MQVLEKLNVTSAKRPSENPYRSPQVADCSLQRTGVVEWLLLAWTAYSIGTGSCLVLIAYLASLGLWFLGVAHLLVGVACTVGMTSSRRTRRP